MDVLVGLLTDREKKTTPILHDNLTFLSWENSYAGPEKRRFFRQTVCNWEILQEKF